MFKKYQCRYFDSRGRTLKPACSQGDSCRFVHPEDANWPGLKPVDKHFVPPAPRKASGSVGWGKGRMSPKGTANSPDYHPERRSAPLVSQNDLFQQCKTEADENSRQHQSQPRTRRDYDDDQSQNRTRGRAMKSDREVRSGSASSSKRYDTGKHPGEHQEGTSSKVSAKNREVNISSLKAETRDRGTLQNSSPSYGERLDKKDVSPPSTTSSSSHVPIAPQGFDRAKERASRVLELFRDLSRLCHQATQDIGDQAKEEKKLKAYTELASTLSEISGTTANPVMPALADILLKHAQCKQRVEANMKTMTSVWEEAFDTFVVEISHAIDVKLEAAVRTIHQEIDNVRSMLGTSSSRSLKRQRTEHRSISSAEDGVETNDTGREYKRRRLGFDVAPAQKSVQSDIQDILMQMKVKIDEQAECLKMLTRENKELVVLNVVLDVLDVPNDVYLMNTLVPSPSPSLDSDTDAFNTADARIHFGPLRSPEKKFHPVLTCLNTPHTRSPLRRSPRTSTPCPSPPITIQSSKQRECTPLNLDEGIASGEEVAISLFPGSPEHHDVLKHEPSSALVTRIMRAHDNPSPPPESPTFPLVDMGHRYSRTLSCSPPPLPDNATEAEQRFDPISVHTPPLTTDSHEMQYNLLSFDSPLTPPIMTPPDTSSASPSHPPLVIHTSVDDPLLLTPGPGYSSACGEPSRFASSSTLTPDLEALANSSITEETPTPTCANMSENLASDMTDAIPQGGSSMISPRLGSLPALLIGDGQQSLSTSEMVTDEQKKDFSCTDTTSDSPKKKGDAVEESTALEDITSSSNSEVEPTSSRDTQSPNRELGSLSPTSSSARVLTHVLPSPPKPSSVKGINVPQDIVSGAPAVVENDPPLPPQPPPLFPQLRKTPIRVTSPFRLSSPTRSCGPQTPAKGRLLPAALDDPQRTPARRILIADAIAQGHASPHKGMNFVGKVPVLKISSTDSPARRVNTDQAPTTPRPGLKLGSSSRIGSPTKHRTAESRPPGMSSGNNGDISCNQTVKDFRSKSQIAGSSSAPATSKPRLLPFPIVASRTAPSQSALGMNTTMDDVGISSPVKSDPPSMPSPAKSSLKQTTSRIPRGVKPYARPPVPGDRRNKLTSVSVEKARATPVSANLSTRNGASFDDAIPNSETTLYGKSASSSSLKRKRGVKTAAPLTKPRPVVLLRQVSRIVPSVDVKVSHPHPGVARSTDVKTVQQIRRVPTIQPIQPMQQGSDSDVPETPDTDTSDGATGPKLQDIPDKVILPSPPGQQDQTTLLVAEPPTRRRTTRTRKSSQPAAITDDVFTETAPLQPRRRANKAQSFGDGVFSGMSAVALKAITSSNTLRNQRYVAAKLETEVVRKPGARPESPAVKIKPTLQRQRDAKGKERRERADRRAKRSDDRIEEGQSDTDKQSDIGDSSAADVDSDWDDPSSSPLRKRHKLAPGDKEDFETPLRPGVGQEDEDGVIEKRRVKWDKGLFTTIYLDEVTMGSRPPPKENVATKGCLAATAKAVLLDTLGNLPDADAPLTELVEENVVVKKFVYDNDVEPVQEIVVVKNTRLRSKKGKD